MSQLSGSRISNALFGLMSGLDDADRALVKRILGATFKVRVPLGDQGATATSVGATPFFTNDTGVNLRVEAAKLLSPVTIAPNATNNVTVKIDKVDDEGSNATDVASYTSNTAGGTAAADVPKALAVVGGTSTAALIADGWTLRASATKGGSGVPIGDGNAPSVLEVTLSYDI